MRSVTTLRFKKSATLKQEDIISSKSGQYSVNLISRIVFLFHQCRVNFYRTHKHTHTHTHTLVFPYCVHLRCHLPLL